MDLISACVLAKMLVVDPEYLYPLRDTDRFTWPGLGSIFYLGQMVNKGNHHNRAVCACVTHLLDRVRVILLQDRPSELRDDVDGTPVTPEQARAIIAERYTVPEEVRQRNNRRARKKRAEQRAERKWQRQ